MAAGAALQSGAGTMRSMLRLPGETGEIMAQQQPVRRKTQLSQTPVVIPDKLYFRIGDVARLCDLPPYVLRFWETEFSQLKPNKGGTGQRLYRKRDVEVVLEIKRLLYQERFTIEGARRLLAEKRRAGSEMASTAQGVAGRKASPERPVEPAASKIAAARPAAAERKTAEKPKIKDLRQEMRDLLTLLGSDPAERKPTPAGRPETSRRETKKSRMADEPTLF
ncbi:MAG: MerR family transcriptional regulator [Acidobacteriaceae bacterium]